MVKINNIKAGDSYRLEVNITEELVFRFAELTGDYNPLHIDKSFADKTHFKGRVAHGMLLGSFISRIVGMHLPGPGSLWLSQNYEFIAPVKIGDTVNIDAKINKISESQGIILLQIEARTQTGLLVLKGEGKVKLITENKKMKNKEIKDCTVLITGGSRGLGAAVALKLADAGACVFLNYKNSHNQALEIQREASKLSGVVELAQGDVTTDKGIENILHKINKETVDIIIFNAVEGIKQALFLDQKLETFEKALDYGMRCPFKLLQQLLPQMINQEFGRIVSILSTYSCCVPPPGFSSYIVNKKALEAITKSIAVEYGKYNICANMVSPNMLRTDLTAEVPERMKQLLEAQTPLKRLAELEEVAESVVYLCSPLSSYVNGHNLILSGGSTII